MPITGAPTDTARSMILHTFSAKASPSEPPNTVTSWLNTNTLRPSMVPQPVTTPSVKGRWWSSPNVPRRWRVSMSVSTNDPGSSRSSRRSRAVSLPRACCFSMAADRPPRRASPCSSLRRSIRSWMVWRGRGGDSAPRPSEAGAGVVPAPAASGALSPSFAGSSRRSRVSAIGPGESSLPCSARRAGPGYAPGQTFRVMPGTSRRTGAGPSSFRR